MNKIFEDATPAEYELLMGVRSTYHPTLNNVRPAPEIKIGLIFVSGFNSDDELEPCLKVHGTPALGCTRLITGKHRVFNPNDAEICVDRYFWDNTTQDKQRALLDHELEHIVVRTDAQGTQMIDAATGRIKLRLKPDDWAITGFLSTVRRFGQDANEVVAIQRTIDEVDQVLTALTEAGNQLCLFHSHN